MTITDQMEAEYASQLLDMAQNSYTYPRMTIVGADGQIATGFCDEPGWRGNDYIAYIVHHEPPEFDVDDLTVDVDDLTVDVVLEMCGNELKYDLLDAIERGDD